MSKKHKNIKWKFKEFRVGDLVLNKKNPKKINKQGFSRLEKSIKKFGLVFGGIVNSDMLVIDGHSRLSTLKPDDRVGMFVPNRKLSEAEYKEINAFYDEAYAGEIDLKKISNIFDNDVMVDWGFSTKDKNGDIEDLPITSELFEEHNYIVLTFDNELDWRVAVDVLGIKKVKSVRGNLKQTGVGRVLKGVDIISRLK